MFTIREQLKKVNSTILSRKFTQSTIPEKV